MLTNMVLNDDGTFKGAFINTVITFTYLFLIIAGVFMKDVRDALLTMQSFMMWFFMTSFGIWTSKKVVEIIVDGKTTKVSDG